MSFCVYGDKSVSLIDLWTIEHVVSGVCLGYLLRKYTKKENMTFEVTFLLLIAYLWETIEHYLEVGVAGEAIAYWFYGIEHWGNRVILDPLSMLLGQYLFIKRNEIILPARIFSASWLSLHIFIFPHSMYLQDDLGGDLSWLCIN